MSIVRPGAIVAVAVIALGASFLAQGVGASVGRPDEVPQIDLQARVNPQSPTDRQALPDRLGQTDRQGRDGAARIVVVIDPGHDERANGATEPIGPGSPTLKIKDGGGTTGVVTGIREADLVLDISLRLRRLLVRAGVRVVMTRTRTAGASMGNIARARIANRASAAVFLRVHADGHPDQSVRGTHALVPALRKGWTDDIYADSRKAAAMLVEELIPVLGFPDRGVNETATFTGLNWSDVPVALVELGFMTNPTEDRALSRGSVRQAAALGLCRGTLRFVGLPRTGCKV